MVKLVELIEFLKGPSEHNSSKKKLSSIHCWAERTFLAASSFSKACLQAASLYFNSSALPSNSMKAFRKGIVDVTYW